MSRNLLGNSAMPNYVKLCAVGILGVTYLTALAVFTWDQFHAVPVPTEVSLVLGTGLSMALGAIGMHQGASILETPAPTQQQPQIPQQNGATNNASPPAA